MAREAYARRVARDSLAIGRRLGYAPATMATSTLNPDYERRPYWHIGMPRLPDRSGRDLPDESDVVVIGGGYAGITAARELARRGTRVTLLEARTLGWGASSRNGGIVHPGQVDGLVESAQQIQIDSSGFADLLR